MSAWPSGVSARRRWPGAVLAALLLAPPAAAEERQVEVAVIVHPEQSVRDLSRTELERIFRLRRQRWDDGMPIYLLMHEEGTHEKRIVLDRIYRMSGDELKRFWLAKIHRGELAHFPKTLASGEAVRRFVSQVRNAIGYVDSRAVDSSVRALQIDGRLPGAEGYLLSGRTSRR